ncbi:MAG: tRNA pseudouridine(65) synthase TruC [Synoicihabitans sp.]
MNAHPQRSVDGDLPLGKGVVLVREDPNGVIALSKPSGILSHPNTTDDVSRSLLTTDYQMGGEYYQWDKEKVWLLNRLDAATSGIVLLSRNETLANTLRQYFKQQSIRKIYAAIVFGRPRRNMELWIDRLSVRKTGGQIRTQAGSGNIPAETLMRCIETNHESPEVVSLLQLEPKTGRSHQLRVQCQRRKLPIVGDATYGEFKLNRRFTRHRGSKRLFLHSANTSFQYLWQGKKHIFSAEAALPEEFTSALTSHV